MLGPSLLSHFSVIKEFFLQSSSADYYDVFSSIYNILFMFLIGLETDIPYLRRNLRRASIIAYGGMLICSIFGLAASFFIIRILKFSANTVALANVIMIILATTASPVVIRLAAELKFSTSDTGRLAICSSLINEITCVLWLCLIVIFMSWSMFGRAILFSLLSLGLIIVNKYIAAWCDQRNRNQKYVTNTEMLSILFLVIALSFLTEEYGFNSTIPCFLLGLFFPREGKTTRTLLIRLAYSVHNFILPIYFGYIGFQFNITYLNSYRNVIAVVLMLILSMGGKIIGTLAACHYLNIPEIDGIILSFLLNMKGHAELLVVGVLRKSIVSVSFFFFLMNIL